MENAFYTVLIKFIERIGMYPIYSDVAFIVSLFFVLMALLLCFIGVKFFRNVSTFMAFVLVALAFTFIMKNSGKGEMVTAFTLIGLLCAAITYRWYRLSAFITAAFIGYSFAALIINILWVNILIGVLFGIAANIFPVIVLLVATSVWGGLYFVIEGISLLGFNLPTYLIIIVSVVVIFAGVFVQYTISKGLLELPIDERRQKLSTN